MLFALLLAAVTPHSALDAERAFAAAARTEGQWTAFRRYAADDAVMFVPQPANAQTFLKERKDPPKTIEWWPTASYVSCDGGIAVNTGGWRRPDGGVGYFSTVWVKQADGGWKWIVDGGDSLKIARAKPRVVKAVRASCDGKAVIDVGSQIVSADGKDDFNAAKDQTVNTGWSVAKDGSRSFFASIWTGRGWRQVIDDKIAPPK